MSYFDINKECSDKGKPKLSKQSYNLFAKIGEVQNFMDSVNIKLIEYHPELAFLELNQGQNLFSKHSKIGIEQRWRIIKKIIKKKKYKDKNIREVVSKNKEYKKDVIDAVSLILLDINIAISFS
ncbi:hypothetical protein DID75_05760 [Candidatus Marinamargulisbacteria bacterium SCGC AG-410-N11]|nr:hypothetical protein DID75_05760 [Candidatus Marinamargulisbacteria bacterium SCGC AG-410-N11]